MGVIATVEEEHMGTVATLLFENLSAEPGIAGERGGSEGRQHGRGRDRAGKVIEGDIETFEGRSVEGGEGAVEAVEVEANSDEAVERGKGRRDRTGEVVAGKIEDP